MLFVFYHLLVMTYCFDFIAHEDENFIEFKMQVHKCVRKVLIRTYSVRIVQENLKSGELA